jgi:hypothetical protein
MSKNYRQYKTNFLEWQEHHPLPTVLNLEFRKAVFWVLYFIFYKFTFDIPTSPHITLAQFVDDIALLGKASSSQLAAHHIQNLADAIDDWCANWCVSVNPTKSKLVQFTYLRNTDPVRININGVRVPTASSVKYLGLTLDTKLTWGIHIKNTVQKARQRFY